jgi:Domain of unknown function (DUF4082)/Concanavalin A-like lectin/glucanases superfamily
MGFGILGAGKLLGAEADSTIRSAGVPKLTGISTINQNLTGDLFGAAQYLVRSVPMTPKFPLTLACWYKCSSITANNAPIPGNNPTQGFPITGIMGFSDFYNFEGAGIGANFVDIFVWNNEWSLEIGNNNVESSLACIAGQNGSPLLVADQWYHIAGVFGPTNSSTTTNTATLYVNGAVVASSSELSWDLGNFVDGVTTMGTVMGLNNFYSLNGGAIGLPAYWNAALTPTQIKRLANGAQPGAVAPAKLITLPRLADGGLIQGFPKNTAYSFDFSGSKATDDLGVQYELGNNFTSAVDGEVTAIKFFKPATDPFTSHTVNLWSQSTGENLATATSESERASGWVTVQLTTPVKVTAGLPYVVSFNAPEGHFQFADEATNPGTYPIRNGPLTAHNGFYLYGGAGYPSAQTSFYYYVDLVFKTGKGASGFHDEEGHYYINVGGATKVSQP